eukprot:1647231-Pyramimonas_sp.AAC.1
MAFPRWRCSQRRPGETSSLCDGGEGRRGDAGMWETRDGINEDEHEPGVFETAHRVLCGWLGG